MKQFVILSLFLFFLPWQVLHAQRDQGTDSLARKNTVGLFQKKLAEQLNVYNGVEELGYPSDIIGNPYYLYDHPVAGSVTYDGVTYYTIDMLYDMVKDVLVIKYATTPSRIRLLNSRLQSFDLAGHHFVRVVAADSIRNLKEGTYDELYSGRNRLLVLRRALTQNEIVDRKAVIRIDPRISFFIVKDGSAFAVGNARQALKIVGDKGAIRSYLKKNKLKYRKQKELVLTKIVSYADSPEN